MAAPLPPHPCTAQVWDYQSSGKHQLIGECRTTLAQLQAMGTGPNLAVKPAAGAATGAPTAAAAAVATAVGAPAAPATPAPAPATPVAAATAAAPPTEAQTASAGVATDGPAAATATAPVAPTATAAAAPVAAVPTPASRSFELTLPATAKNSAVGKCGTLLVRQVQVRPGPTAQDLVSGCLQGCLG